MTTSQRPELLPGQDILAALEMTRIPEENWTYGDDLCNCTFQRIGMWTNPYIGRTLKVRLCCIWAKIYAMFPECVQEVPAFMDYNHGDRYIPEPTAWDGDVDMPLHLWHRQLAAQMHLPLDAVRKLFAGQAPPKGRGKGIRHVTGGASGKVFPTVRAGGNQGSDTRRGERAVEASTGHNGKGTG